MRPSADEIQRYLSNSGRSAADVALLSRIHRYFDAAIEAIPNKEKAKILSAPDDFSTMVGLLAAVPIEQSPELKVRLRGAIAKRELLDLDGGSVTPSEAGALLNITRQAVGQRRAAGKLLGIPGPNGYTYPVWQFKDHDVLDGFADVLTALNDHDPWMQLIFFVRENDAANGKRPLDLLRKGKLDAVLRAAALYGVQAAV